MANHTSAKKRIRQTAKRTDNNRYYKTRIKTITKNLKVALDEKNVQKATEIFKIVNKDFHKFVSKGILKKNTAARKVSMLNASLKALVLSNA